MAGRIFISGRVRSEAVLRLQTWIIIPIDDVRYHGPHQRANDDIKGTVSVILQTRDRDQEGSQHGCYGYRVAGHACITMEGA